MSKKNSIVPEVSTEPVIVDAPVSAPTEKMAEVDRLSLELAKASRRTALAEAQTALAKNENSELAYKYIVLQIYMKYGLTDADAITEGGDILRGGAAAASAAKA